MILRELVVHNYRPFQNETFYFSERVTVIAGVNGRGKSSILDAVACLLSRLLPQVSPAVGGYRYLRLQDIHHGQAALQLELAASFGELTIQFQLGYDSERGQRGGKLLPQFGQGIREQNGSATAPIAVYYTTDRASYRLPKREITGLRQDQAAAWLGALFNRQIDFRDFMSRYSIWFESVTNNEDPGGRNGRTMAMIDRVIGLFLPGFARIGVERTPFRLVFSKGEERLDLTQISDGERALLAMLIDLCRRLVLANPGLEDPLQGTGVVLIDEIELHLHVRWQREIIEKLRTTFPKIQFILTTHSPFIVQTLRDGELRLLADDLDDDSLQEPGEYSNRGLEDVAIRVMGIKNPNVVPRYNRMREAAHNYYAELAKATPGDERQLIALREKLDKLVEPYPDDPAFRAFLEFQTQAHMSASQNETGAIDEAD